MAVFLLGVVVTFFATSFSGEGLTGTLRYDNLNVVRSCNVSTCQLNDQLDSINKKLDIILDMNSAELQESQKTTNEPEGSGFSLFD